MPTYPEPLLTSLLAAVARTDDPVCPTAVGVLKQSTAGGSGAFLVVAADGHRYWCKALNNPQHPRVPINEQVVGRLGRRLDLFAGTMCDEFQKAGAKVSGFSSRRKASVGRNRVRALQPKA